MSVNIGEVATRTGATVATSADGASVLGRDIGSLSDTDLVRKACGPDVEAFGELFRRHCQPGWRMAQGLAATLPDAAAALTAGFARALAGVRGHPASASEPFRPLLLGAIYRCAFERPEAPNVVVESAAGAGFPEMQMLRASFRSLPDRWRATLWLSEVEGLTAEGIAPILGVSATVAAQLIIRSHRGLADRFRQAKAEVPKLLGSALRDTTVDAPLGLATVAEEVWRLGLTLDPQDLEATPSWLREHATRRVTMGLGGLLALGLVGLGVLGQRGGLTSFGPAALGRGPSASGTVGVGNGNAGARGPSVLTVPATVAVKFQLRGSGEALAASGAPADSTQIAQGAVSAPASGSATPVSTPGSGEFGVPGGTPAPSGGIGTTNPTAPVTVVPPGGLVTPPVTTPGITTPGITTPPVTVAPVTVGPVTVGPVTVGPVTVGPVTVGPVTVPQVGVPSITLPSATVGPITVGPVTVPPVTVPAITVPAITVPALTVPKVTVPGINIPKLTLPGLTIPPLVLPGVSSAASVSTLKVPAVNVQTPKLPEVSAPAVSSPAVKPPSIKIPAIITPTVSPKSVELPPVTTPVVTTTPAATPSTVLTTTASGVASVHAPSVNGVTSDVSVPSGSGTTATTSPTLTTLASNI